MRENSQTVWRAIEGTDGRTFAFKRDLKREVAHMPDGFLKRPLDWFVTIAGTDFGAEFLAKKPRKRP